MSAQKITPDVKDMEGLSGIIGMNMLSKLKDLSLTTDGMKKMNKYNHDSKKVGTLCQM